MLRKIFDLPYPKLTGQHWTRIISAMISMTYYSVVLQAKVEQAVGFELGRSWSIAMLLRITAEGKTSRDRL